MLLYSLLRNWKRSAPAARRCTRTSPRRRASFCLRLEALEHRWLFSTLTVTTNSDSGAGSLRAAIAAAQSGDTIVFADVLSSSSSKPHGHGTTTSTPGTITLTSGELALIKNLTIQGPGAGKLIISGTSPASIQHGQKPSTTPPPSRVFEVAPTATIALIGLTISGGDGIASASSVAAWDGDGGGILDHGTLTVSGCAISGNYSRYEGGGIFSDGTLTLSGCTLAGNDAGFEGGGIFNHSTLTLSNCTVSNCFVYGDSAAYEGGGIFSDGTLMASNCTVSGNKGFYCGGIANWGTATIISSTITSNDATVVQPLLTYPWFPEGGGIYNHGTLTLNGCTVSGNATLFVGAGIFNDLDATLTVENFSSITGNLNGDGFPSDVDNLGVLHVDGTSTIGSLDG